MSAAVTIHEIARYVVHRGHQCDVEYSSCGGHTTATIRANEIIRLGTYEMDEIVVKCGDGADCTPFWDTADGWEITIDYSQWQHVFEAAGYTPTDAWTEMMSALEDAYQELTRKPEPKE